MGLEIRFGFHDLYCNGQISVSHPNHHLNGGHKEGVLSLWIIPHHCTSIRFDEEDIIAKEPIQSLLRLEEAHFLKKLILAMSDAGDDGQDVEVGDGGTRDFGGITEITEESYIDKMQGACCGVCIGLLLFFGSMGLLVWNEGRAVRRQKDLDEGQKLVVDIQLENFNKTTVQSGLVHVTGLLSTPSVLRDDIFGVTTGSDNASIPEYQESALRLKRTVQMYQWSETSTSKKVETFGDGTKTETTYSYEKVWSSDKYDSSTFKDQSGSYANPTSWPFENEDWGASQIFLGSELQLAPGAIDGIFTYEPIGDIDIESIPNEELQQKVTKESSNSLYYKSGSSSSSNPQIGDMEMDWSVVIPQIVSVVAELQNGMLDSFETSRGGSVLLIEVGEHTSAEMFQQAEDDNTFLTWVLRCVGFLLMIISILMVLSPIATALDIIPFVGDCIGDGLELCVFPCLACVVSVPITLFVISLAWLVHRPMIAIPMCVAGGAIMCCLVVAARRSKKPENVEGANAQPPNPQQYQGHSAFYSEDQKVPDGGSSYEPEHRLNLNHNDLPPFSQALEGPPPIATSQAPYVPYVYKP